MLTVCCCCCWSLDVVALVFEAYFRFLMYVVDISVLITFPALVHAIQFGGIGQGIIKFTQARGGSARSVKLKGETFVSKKG